MVLLFVTDSLYHKRHITVTTFGYVPFCFFRDYFFTAPCCFVVFGFLFVIMRALSEKAPTGAGRTRGSVPTKRIKRFILVILRALSEESHADAFQ